MPRNRRLVIVAALGIVELWILGLMLRSLCGNCRHGDDAARAAQFAGSAPDLTVADAHGVRTFETGSAPSVVIDAGDTALAVSVRSGTSVAVLDQRQSGGWMSGGRRGATVERIAGGLRIALPDETGGGLIGLGWSSRRLAVVVPPDARLEVRNAGSTSVDGLRAGAHIHTDAGSIAVHDMRGALTLTTGDGRIELSDVQASALDVNSDDGRIMLDGVRADTAAVGTDDGRIAVKQSLLRGGKIHTGSGRIELGLDPLSNVTLNVRASSGKIVARSPLTVSGDGDDDDAPAAIRFGDGTGRLEVGSDDGSIQIQAEAVKPT